MTEVILLIVPPIVRPIGRRPALLRRRTILCGVGAWELGGRVEERLISADVVELLKKE